MGHFVVLFLIVIQSTVFLGTATADCEFWAESPKPPIPRSHLTSPIFADMDGNILYPERGALTLRILNNEKIQISCSGGNIYTYENGEQKKVGNNFLIAKCEEPHILINGMDPSPQINNVFCMNYPVHRVYDLKQTCTTTDGRYLEAAIGFEISNKSKYKIYFCFDSKTTENPGATQLAFFSKHYLSPLIGTDETETASNFVPDSFNTPHGQKITDAYITSKLTETEEMNITSKFKPDGIYQLGCANIDTLYDIPIQRQTINTLLGLEAEDNTVIQDDKNYYLARGHLAPVRDFYYKFEQEATYHFINAVPQWQCINNGNWKSLEYQLQNSNKLRGSWIETGHRGVMTYFSRKTNNFEPLYLYVNPITGEKALPVPLVLYKSFYDSVLGKITIFVVNNPYLSVDDIEDDIVPIACLKTLEKITWLSFPKAKDTKSGYVYACITA